MTDIIETPIIEIIKDDPENERLIIHNLIHNSGKMILSKEQASFLLIELYKFINDTTNSERFKQ
jgi:hypothetical protein